MTFRCLRNVKGFFSDYYLGSIFGRGEGSRRRRLSDRETDLAYRRFRRLCAQAEGRCTDAPECRERFIRPLLRDVLGFYLGEGDNRVHRLFQSAEQASGVPLVAAYCGEWDEDLDEGPRRQLPVRQLEQALQDWNVEYGFLITGERFRLIRASAPGQGLRGAHIEADLAGLADDDDPESFAAFLRLCSVRQFIPDSKGQPVIRQIETESRQHAQKVSEDLKQAVFATAETLTQALLDDARTRGRLAEPEIVPPEPVRNYRDAVLLALYRLLFILYAESRDKRLESNPIYQRSYALHTLIDDLLADPDRPLPGNRMTFWLRLRALFKLYDRGLPAIEGWNAIPARGGQFFSSETTEGRLLDEAQLSDGLVARVLLDLTTTSPRLGVGRERVSFRELDIESLGAVYEGLLEYEARVAKRPLLELRVQGRSYVLDPEETVRLCREKQLRLLADPEQVAGTTAESLLAGSPEEETPELPGEEAVESDDSEVAEDGQEDVGERLSRGVSARVVQRLEPGTFYFAPSVARKGTGSFYTPPALVKDLVRHALSPVVEGKSSQEVENLRVLDPACGSAHFLVEAMRVLGKELHRAYVREYNGRPPPEFTHGEWDTDWKAEDEQARAANSEARAWCKRRIAERCLFGVDVNPTAVQLAHVALWVESLAGDRPLSYFEHHIRCGNSLIGTWFNRVDEPPIPTNPRRSQQGQLDLFAGQARELIRQAAEHRRRIDELDPGLLQREGIEPETAEAQQFKDHQRRQAEQKLASAKLLFDLRSASAFVPEIWGDWATLCGMGQEADRLAEHARSRSWWPTFKEVRERERFFHWELEFPEIFLDQEHPGFDAVVGNPPWDKIKPDRKEFYGRHDVLIRAFVGGELDRRIKELQAANPALRGAYEAYEERVKTQAAYLKHGGDYRYDDWEVDGKSTGGDPDLFKFFVERAWQLAREGGRVAFVVPSAIYNNEGCTGLRHLLLNECQVERFYAFENRQKLFPIDSRYKFVNLVFRKGRPERDDFQAAFMRHDPEELASKSDKPWMVLVRRRELERLSPGTLAFLEYRSPRDREILLKMYGYDTDGNPINPRPLLGDQGPGTWNARFYTEFHMTNDRDLWTDSKTGKLWNPRQILGRVRGTTDRPPYYDPAHWPEIRARMAEKGFWPLYEGKHIEQFLVDIKPIERWVSLEAAKGKYGRTPDASPKVVFRDIASNTNERTCIAAVLPEKSCANNKLPVLSTQSYSEQVAANVLNSFTFDFALRLRVFGTLNFTHVARVAVPQLDTAARGAVAVETVSACAYGTQHVGEIRRLWSSFWASNRAVAEAYGLTPDDFEYILSTFPVFARKRPEFYAYLQKRLAEWKAQASAKRRVVVTARVKERPRVKVDGRTRYNQAAALAWLVRNFNRPDLGRVGHDKALYFIQEHVGVDLGFQFDPMQNGPWDTGMWDVESLAQKQGWLVINRPPQEGGTRFEVGPRIAVALAQAEKKFRRSTVAIVALLQSLDSFGTSGLERWATIHWCWKQLRRQGKPTTEDAIVAAVEAWKPDRLGFDRERLRRAILGMEARGLIKLNRAPVVQIS